VLNTFLVNPTADVLIHEVVGTEYHHHDNNKVLLPVADVVERIGTLVKLKRKSSVSKEELMCGVLSKPARGGLTQSRLMLRHGRPELIRDVA
jgi:hypothetical protein